MHMAESRREKLLETSLALFCQNGFHATGIDRILAEAGVAKMTLYKHFRSKDDLIVAALKQHDEKFRTWFRDAVEARARGPRKRLLAVFDVLEEWYKSAEFHGCVFTLAAGEFAAAGSPAHMAAAEHKAAMRTYFQDLAREAGADDGGAIGEQIALLVEGATTTANVSGEAAAARRARRMAKALLKNAGL
jgi:AcrR family transcriptional regulator